VFFDVEFYIIYNVRCEILYRITKTIQCKLEMVKMEAEEQQLEDEVVDFFKKRALHGNLMMSIPEVAAGLKVSRRKIEPALLLLSKGKDPKLYEIVKGRIKYYILRDVVEFCKERWGSIHEETA